MLYSVFVYVRYITISYILHYYFTLSGRKNQVIFYLFYLYWLENVCVAGPLILGKIRKSGLNGMYWRLEVLCKGRNGGYNGD